MTDLALVQACEERLINCWPAVQTLVMGDWVLRFANGYSGRANSASALRAGADFSADTLAPLVTAYRAAGLAPAIRVTPLSPPDLGERLAGQGWRAVVTSIGMVAPLRPRPCDGRVEIAAGATPAWVAGVAGWQEARKSNPDHLAAIVGLVRLPAGFATLFSDGEPRGYAMSVVDRGIAELGSVVVGPGQRGRGLGRILVEGTLGWAAGQGASRAFLQVEQGNQVAIGLYHSLGFTEIYRYTEYRL